MTRPGMKSFWIGIFVIVAISIVIASLFLLRPTVGDGLGNVRVRFSSLDKVNVGTRVTFAGMSVGQVSAIRVLKDARSQKTDPSGRFYFYELELKIDSHVQVYSCDDIGLQTSGLFGEKFITITPRAATGAQPAQLLSNTSDPIYATIADPIEEALSQIYTLSDKFEQMLDRMLTLLQNNQADVTSAVVNIRQTFEELHQMLAHVNALNIVGSMQDASNNVGNTMQRLDKELQRIGELKAIDHLSATLENLSQISSAFNQPQKIEQIITQCESFSAGLARVQEHFEKTDFNLGAVLSNISSAAENTKKMSEELGKVSHAFTEGQGSLGKLLNKDDLYLQVMVVLSKVETLMNDLNQYGLLFSSNRNWQKHRVVRMGQLSKIKTPQQMISFFEQEIDQVSTALSRMGQVAKEAELVAGAVPQNEDLFKQSFREVLNKLENVQGMVKLYNEQLYSVTKQQDEHHK